MTSAGRSVRATFPRSPGGRPGPRPGFGGSDGIARRPDHGLDPLGVARAGLPGVRRLPRYVQARPERYGFECPTGNSLAPGAQPGGTSVPVRDGAAANYAWRNRQLRDGGAARFCAVRASRGSRELLVRSRLPIRHQTVGSLFGRQGMPTNCGKSAPRVAATILPRVLHVEDSIRISSARAATARF